MPRMNILNAVEQEAFESPPVFNSVQRKQYFDFPIELRRLAGELRAPTHQLGFLVSKAAESFFPPSAILPPQLVAHLNAKSSFWESGSQPEREEVFRCEVANP
jgi:hypothetical protein